MEIAPIFPTAGQNSPDIASYVYNVCGISKEVCIYSNTSLGNPHGVL